MTEENKPTGSESIQSVVADGERPRPLQIVKTGDAASNYSFTLDEENLDHVLNQIPEDMKVAVVSVVGAFRTGKSFLLSFFLRYLHSEMEGSSQGLDWLKRGGEALREGNANLGVVPDGTAADSSASDTTPMSFQWRGGQQRMTTGIWLWSEPFVRRAANGEKVAVLIVDTQGMFDNETSMGLTACIFGLSTLISSHQIYNVEKRIQEDHLQQLALFSEYGRMALARDDKNEEESERDSFIDSPSSNSTPSSVPLQTPAKTPGKALFRTPARTGSKTPGNRTGVKTPRRAIPIEEESDDEVEKPFQLLEFLVRDWQNFDDDEDVTQMQKAMDTYLKDVIKDRSVTDLQATRDQIMACFEKIACFGLCHPGMDVVKKTYDGAIAKIDPMFCKLLDAYARRTFGDDLEPKRIHGRQLTAPELRTYIGAYVKLFHEGASFPEAKTLLEATSAANNSNAKFAAVARYKSEMERIAGPRSKGLYIQRPEFLEHHEACIDGALELFDNMATMGRKSAVRKCREELELELANEFERFDQVNEGRRPFKNMELYLLPMGVAAAAFVLRFMADASCSSWSTTCRRTADGLGHIYVAIFVFMAISSAGRMKAFIDHIRTVLPVLLGNAQAASSNLAKSKGD